MPDLNMCHLYKSETHMDAFPKNHTIVLAPLEYGQLKMECEVHVPNNLRSLLKITFRFYTGTSFTGSLTT